MERGEFSPVRIRMVEKRGQCSYKLGHEFVWKGWTGPRMCGALKDLLRQYVFMCSLGAPSWEADASRWYLSCPSKKGTVWLVEATGKKGKCWVA